MAEGTGQGMSSADLELFERSLRHATTSHTDIGLDEALAEIGWHDALAIDRRAAVSLLFELQGAASATSSALDHVVTSALGLQRETTSVVLPALGQWSPPGRLEGQQLHVNGLGTAGVGRGDDTLVVAAAGGKELAFVVATAELVRREIHGVDPWAGMLEVTGERIEVGTTGAGPAAWASAVALGQLAVAHELLGTARTMLALAREHALERIQFGRPISTFQAVRHRLAETLVAIETADAMLAVAWEDELPQSAAMAKALAGRGARTAARHCQQVLAGIGFTTEHPLHRSIRRVLVLDELFGSAQLLTRSLGRQLIDDRQLPPVLPL